jgi:hypothetical protein
MNLPNPNPNEWEAWLCVDCTIVNVNGDASGIDSAERLAEVESGLAAIGATGHLSANWDSETGEGIREFSRCGCDACGSRLAGTFHRFAVQSRLKAPCGDAIP